MQPPQRLVTSAWAGHIPFAMYLIEHIRPAVFVELGVHYGVSYCAMCQAVKALDIPSQGYGVDTWQGDPQAGHYGPEVLQNLREHHDPMYGSFSNLLQTTFDDAVSYFNDGYIDLLHIDGLHTYDAVRHDFETWRPKLSSAGVVLFHDTQSRQPDFGVWKFWEEIRLQYPSFEFTHCYGLGVLAVGSEAEEKLPSLFRASASEGAQIKKFFYRLGFGLDKICDQWNQKHTPVPQEIEPDSVIAAQMEQDIVTVAPPVQEEDSDMPESNLAVELKKRLSEIESLRDIVASEKKEFELLMETANQNYSVLQEIKHTAGAREQRDRNFITNLQLELEKSNNRYMLDKNQFQEEMYERLALVQVELSRAKALNYEYEYSVAGQITRRYRQALEAVLPKDSKRRYFYEQLRGKLFSPNTNSRLSQVLPSNGQPVIENENNSIPGAFVETTGRKIAVFIHLYYVDLWPELYETLKRIKFEFDVYINVPAGISVPDSLFLSKIPHAHIFRFENLGRDIWPFFQMLNHVDISQYNLMLKIHGKKSIHIGDQGNAWREDIFSKIIGTEHHAGSIAAYLNDHPEVGMIGPAGHVLKGSFFIGGNKDLVEHLAVRINQPPAETKEYFFSAGSMFWFTPEMAKILLGFPISRADFEADIEKLDGTMAHAMERFIGLLCSQAGMCIAEINEPAEITQIHKKNEEIYGSGGIPQNIILPTDITPYTTKLAEVKKDPLIIFQPGKVGSMSVYLSLIDAYEHLELPVDIHHIHVLANLDKHKEIANNNSDIPTLKHVEQCMSLLKRIKSKPEKPWRIITMVRDPVGSNLGTFFYQLADYIPNWKQLHARRELPLTRLLDVFLNSFNHAGMDAWFDDQLKSIFNIDVYSQTFPAERGYQTYHSGSQNASLLLMRTEDMNRVAPFAMREYLGLRQFILKTENVGEHNPYGELYNEFRREVALPRNYVEDIYNLRISRHFYLDHELAFWETRWTKSGNYLSKLAGKL